MTIKIKRKRENAEMRLRASAFSSLRSCPMLSLQAVLVALLWAIVRVDAAGFTVATYNVENYTLADRLVEGVYRPNYPKPENAKAALRKVLRAIDADVVLLQEMGPRPFLLELQRDLAAEGLVYAFAHVVTASDADRHSAVLAKVAPHSLSDHTDLVFTYLGKRESVKRGLLQLEYRWGSLRLTLYGVHLKSRHTDFAEDPESAVRRAGEATALRNRILELHPDPARDLFLIAGDFNDNKASRPVRALLQRGKTLLTALIPAADSRGETWTYRYHKDDSYSRVDLLLASPALQPFLPVDGARIFDGADVAVASDHRPVAVTLALPPPFSKLKPREDADAASK